MKKVLYILLSGLLTLALASCVKEQLVTFDLSNATAPAISQIEVGEKAITVSFSPADFNVGFNQKMPVNYSIILTSLDGKTVNITVPATFKDNTATISIANLSKTLIAQGLSEGSSASLEMILRAAMNGASADISGGSLDAAEKIKINNYEIVIPATNPWVGYDEVSAWGLIGAIESVGMNWDSDIVMYTNGSQHVARAVKLSANDQFKFRKDKAWGENFGAEGDTEPFVIALDTTYPAAAGGKNLAVPADGYYDLLLDPEAKTFVISEAYIAYPGFTESSAWSVIGAIASFEMSWDKDIAMTTDGEWHVAEGVTLTVDDQFKFRKDQAWGENFGAEGDTEPFVLSLDTEYPAAAGGKNLAVPANGVYDLLLNPDAKLFKIVETLGGKSSLIGGDEPEPPVVTESWGLIGIGGDWENDLVMAENDGVWSIITTIAATDSWKIRKNASWDENYGGPGEDDVYVLTIGTPITGVAGGKNLAVPADGNYMVTFNATTLEITVSEADIWSLIGDFNSWGGDVDMVLTDGKWVSPATHLSGGFKIRHNHDWTLSVGGTMAAIGEPFDAISTDGPNISVEEGDYVVTYDPEAQKIVVNLAKTANCWSVIGAFNGWADDAYMTQVAPGIWISEELELTADGWKIRFDNNWDINRGGATPAAAGEFVAAYPGGDDIKFGGKARVVFNENNQTIGTLVWGVVGKISAIEGFNWNNDIPMNLAGDGKWYSVPVALADGDEIKIRYMAGWDDDRGGSAEAADEAFAVTKGGANIKAPKAGTYMVVYDPTAETITLSTDFWSLIGEFNSWSGDRFMLPLGEGKWAAYNQEISGGWKIRKGADWAVSAGGTYVAAGEPFDAVTDNGANIAVTDMTRFDVLYDTAAGKITVSKPVK